MPVRLCNDGQSDVQDICRLGLCAPCGNQADSGCRLHRELLEITAITRWVARDRAWSVGQLVGPVGVEPTLART